MPKISWQANLGKSTGIKPYVKIFSSKKIPTLTIMTLLVLGTFANIPVMNFTPAYAAPLTSVSVVPTSTLTGIATQYQVTFTTATTGTIHSIVVTFPSDYNFGTTVPNFVTSTNIRSDGTLAVDNTAKTLTYTLPRDQIITSGTTLILSFGNVLNPTTNFASLSINSKTVRADASVIDGPTAFSLALANNFATTAAGTITSAGALTVSTGGMTVSSGATTFLGNTDFGLGNTESVKLPAAGIILRNPAQTFATTLAGGAVAANRTLNLPVTTVTDTLAALGMTQTWTGTNTFNGAVDHLTNTDKFGSSSIIIRNPAQTFATTLAGGAVAANRTLNLPVTTQAETIAVQPTVLFATPADPTGTTSLTGVMAGTGVTFTPKVTGRVLITVSGDLSSLLAADGAQVDIRTGTGAAPANGAALTGTVAGNAIQVKAVSTAANLIPFSITVQVTGLTVGTTIWIDEGEYAVTASTGSIKNLSVSVIEF